MMHSTSTHPSLYHRLLIQGRVTARPAANEATHVRSLVGSRTVRMPDWVESAGGAGSLLLIQPSIRSKTTEATVVVMK